MCLIAIHKYNGTNPVENKEFLEDISVAIMNNPDGIGIMYAQDGRLITEKKLFKTEEETLDYYVGKLDEAYLNKQDLVVHLRYTTRGETSEENCHPFKVFSQDDGDAIDLAMMHNGTISKVKASVASGQSDTSIFVEEVVKPALRNKPTMIRQKGFRDLLEFSIEDFNKLVFMDSKGFINIVNSDKFTTKHGAMFSNVYSFDPYHRTPTTSYWGSGYESTLPKKTTASTKQPTTTPITSVKNVTEDDAKINSYYDTYLEDFPKDNDETLGEMCKQLSSLTTEELEDEVWLNPQQTTKALKFLLTEQY